MTGTRTGTRENGPDGTGTQASGGSDPFGMFGASLSASMEAMTAWSRTWQSLLEARGGPSASLMMGALADPTQGLQSVAPLMEEFRRALALPRFADLPAPNGALLPSPEAAVDLMMLVQQYLAAVMPVWVKAGENFQAEVEARRARGETADLLADGMDIWNGVLDRTLMEFNRSQDFAALQQRMLRLAMQQRQDLRRRAEMAAEAIDMPTRTEMLDVYARLHGLMREVHSLRREVRALKAGGASSADHAAPDAP